MKRTHTCRCGIAAPLVFVCGILGANSPFLSPSLAMEQPTMQAAQPVETMTRDEIAGQLRRTLVRPEYSRIPICDVFDSIARTADVDFVIDWADSAFDEGLAPDAMLSLTLRRAIPADRALDLILKRISTGGRYDESLAWNIEEGFVRIGSKRELNRDRYAVVYPIHDLVMEVPSFKNAARMNLDAVLSGSDDGSIAGPIFDEVDSSEDERTRYDRRNLPPGERLAHDITELIEPFQWERNGGTGGQIRYLESAGSLLVVAPNYIHRQIGVNRH